MWVSLVRFAVSFRHATSKRTLSVLLHREVCRLCSRFLVRRKDIGKVLPDDACSRVHPPEDAIGARGARCDESCSPDADQWDLPMPQQVHERSMHLSL